MTTTNPIIEEFIAKCRSKIYGEMSSNIPTPPLSNKFDEWMREELNILLADARKNKIEKGAEKFAEDFEEVMEDLSKDD